MAPLGIVFPDPARAHDFPSGQGIDQGRFARTGGAQQRNGCARTEVCLQPVQAEARIGADGDCLQIRTQGGSLFLHFRRVRTLVRLRQHCHGLRAARRCHGGVTGNPVQAEVMIQGRDDKYIVDVRDQRLHQNVLGKPVRMAAPVRAEKYRPPGQDGPDQAVSVRIHRNLHIVAHHRVFLPVTQAAGQHTVQGFVILPDQIPVPVNQNHAILFFQPFNSSSFR